MPATCKSCGAQILWARTQRGKRIPLDAVPQTRAVLVGTLRDDGNVSLVDTYMPHHATCSSADEHRNKTDKRQLSLLGEDDNATDR